MGARPLEDVSVSLTPSGRMTRCIERMGDQCVNIAKLIPLSGHESPKDKEILDAIDRMGHFAHDQVAQVKEALKTRRVSPARDLARQDEQINRINRDIFHRAAQIGDDPEVREWAMFMILVARALERIGDKDSRDRRTARLGRHRPVQGSVGHRIGVVGTPKTAGGPADPTVA